MAPRTVVSITLPLMLLRIEVMKILADMNSLKPIYPYEMDHFEARIKKAHTTFERMLLTHGQIKRI